VRIAVFERPSAKEDEVHRSPGGRGQGGGDSGLFTSESDHFFLSKRECHICLSAFKFQW
jgi:hypothetical protein